MGVNLEGFDDLLDDIRSMADRLGQESPYVSDALKSAAAPIYDQMKTNASTDPRIRTGRLHGAIRIGPVKNRKKYSGKSVSIGVSYSGSKMAPHAHLVEFGHAGPYSSSPPTPPHPFVRPAFDSKKEAAYAILRERLKNALK